MEEGEKYETPGLSSVVVLINGRKGLLVVTGLLWRRLLCWKDGREVIKREEEVQRCSWNCVELPVDAGSASGTIHVLSDLMVWLAGQRRNQG